MKRWLIVAADDATVGDMINAPYSITPSTLLTFIVDWDREANAWAAEGGSVDRTIGATGDFQTEVAVRHLSKLLGIPPTEDE